MDAKLYNKAWESVEFLLFEYIEMKVDLKVATGVFTKAEGEKLYRENQAAIDAILKTFGVTQAELNAETDRIMEDLRNDSSS